MKETSDRLRAQYDELNKIWEHVDKKIREGAELARFERDCDRAEHWMDVREQVSYIVNLEKVKHYILETYLTSNVVLSKA